MIGRNGGFLRNESLSVTSRDYIVKFEEHAPRDEDSTDLSFEAEYMTYDNDVRESEDVPAFFRGFLKENFKDNREQIR